MAGEAPTSSWHPALMPHNDAEPTPAEPGRKPSPDASPDSLHNGTPLEQEPEPSNLDLAATDADDGDAWFNEGDSKETADGDAWFAEDDSKETGDGDAWLVEEGSKEAGDDDVDAWLAGDDPKPAGDAVPETAPEADPEAGADGDAWLANDDSKETGDADTCFAGDDVNEGGATLASGQAVTHHKPTVEAPATDAPVEAPTDATTAPPAHTPQEPPTQIATEAPAEPPAEDRSLAQESPEKSPTKSQHGSSMSFARTVSHEITFGDDDDQDFSLPRTNTDPFKFMPPNERTNSFPVPPPMTSGHDISEDQPLPANQAAELLDETEHWDLDAQDKPAATQEPEEAISQTTQPTRPKHGASRSMGGDIQAFEEEATDTRYEEGVPLIPGSNELPQATPIDEKKDQTSFFGDEAGDDDFFGNDVPAAESEIKPLERKSTSQFTESFDDQPPTRQNTFEAVAEEDEAPQPESKPAPSSQAPARGHRRTKTQDWKDSWKAAYGDDDDDDFFLEDSAVEDKKIDSTAFLDSDDDGFLDDTLDDTEDAAPAPHPAPSAPASQPASQPASRQPSGANPYAPQNTYQPASPAYQPPQLKSQVSHTSLYTPPIPTSSTFASTPQYGGPPPLSGTDSTRAQSFADKTKGGYASPYDLPSDIVSSVPKPRKRPSTQSLYSPGPAAQPTPPMAPPGPPASNSRPPSSHGAHVPPPVASQKMAAPPLRSKGSFFEDLPMSSKSRPTSKQSNRVPSPSQYQQGPPQGPPQGVSLGPSPLGPSTTSASQTPPTSAPSSHAEPSPPLTGMSNLVAPEKVSPYAALQSGVGPAQPPSSNSTRYSPAPGQAPGGGVPVAAGNRYSPAPSAPRQSSYSPSRTATTTPPVLPHQPRTSSPLAHFDSSGKAYGDVSLAERRSSSSYEPRLNRVASLPPTREEVEEEDDTMGAGVSLASRHASESRYAPAPTAEQQKMPPPSAFPQRSASPPKRASSYAPQAPPTSQPGFVPPPRAQTQSPGATHGNQAPVYGHARRPSSAHSANAPDFSMQAQSSYAPQMRPRGQSLVMNIVPPTDGREQDPLQRWKGVPIFAWGVGGTVVTSFPKSIPRYTVASTTPTYTRTLGEVKITHIKEIEPLPERLAKFPGPLKGKSKKKETVAWLNAGIDALEKEIPDLSFHSELSLEAKRSIERLLMWKILRVFIEHDGVLEGTPAVEKAVSDILSPETEATAQGDFSGLPTGVSGTIATPMQADAVDAGTMESVRMSLMKGDREAAVWTAVDKRLWGHAMLIANTVSPDLYKQVAQEFVRKEVNYAGHNNEPMAALYKILSGNHEDSVDELVPSHARAGFQLMSTDASSGPTKGAIDGLDKWKETLALVLSNRSPDDVRGLNALGSLLAGYGRAEAAHICFMFSRSVSVFGGLDDPKANFVLLGSDHKQQASRFAKETEALELSEVYEYGLSLAGGNVATGGAPHLAAYKLQHAMTLAEYGQRDKAMQYCEAIVAAISSQTKRSPYYNSYLAASVDSFITRLKQAPKGEAGSWMSKPSMNKVSDSMWNKFNKFVSGDDDEANAAAKQGENSPFGHITPTISRSPSASNFESYGGAAPGFSGTTPSFVGNTTPAIPAVPSKYAPAAAQPSSVANPYAPGASSAANNGTESPAYFGGAEPSYPGAPSSAQGSSYAPMPSFQAEPNNAAPAPAFGGYQPGGLSQSASMPSLSHIQGQGQGQDSMNQGYTPNQTYSPYGYEPPQMNMAAPEPEQSQESGEQATGGYEPPSYQPQGYEPPSYEPPSYQPDAPDDDEAPKPKKSFMDDDEDDIPALRPSSQEKSKADKDRENQEMFRKAAEEDAKRAEAEKAAKKGWGFGGWFSKKPDSPKPGEIPNKPVRANLGEASSFVYDPDLKRWVNKAPGAENVEAKKPAPPPPKAGGAPRSVSGTPPPPPVGTPPPMRSASQGPPPRSIPPGGAEPPRLNSAASQDNLGVPQAPAMARSASNTSMGGPPSAPPSRPGTSMSNASSIDDLLGAPGTTGPRKGKKPRKSGRYVDVMAK